MKKEIRNIILLYTLFVLIKIIFSYFIPSSRGLADDYQYLKMSESFFYHFSLKVHGAFSGQFYPLYPIIISISHIFTNNEIVYLTIKIINVILSSLIIFPSYYLSREFLSEKKSLLVATVISLLPANFGLGSYIMSENLFYSLFLITIYFIYKSFKEKKTKYYILTGIFCLLSILTRIHGLVLIVLIAILISMNFFKKDFIKKYWIVILLIIVLLFLWYKYANFVIYSVYTTEALALIKTGRILALIIKYISYFGFLLLGSGLMLMLPFFISFSVKNKNLILFRKITLLTLIVSLFLAANHALSSKIYSYNIGNIVLIGGRTIGRYIDFCLPLIVILGFIGLDHYFKKIPKFDEKLLRKLTILSCFIMLVTTSIMLTPLVPLNNISLTIFGVLKYVLEIIFYSKGSFDFGTKLIPFIVISLIFVLLPILNYFLLKKLNYKRFISIFLIVLVINAIISMGVVYYAATTSWYYNSEQRQLALYLNKIDPKRSTVLIDQRSEGDLGGLTYDPKALYVNATKSKYTILGYWLNDELIIGDINNNDVDYIISTYDLNLDKIYQTNNGIYLYKIK